MSDGTYPTPFLSSTDLARIARNADKLEFAYRSQGIDALRTELQALLHLPQTVGIDTVCDDRHSPAAGLLKKS